MTKDEALLMCLEYIEKNAHERKYVRHAIKAALEAKDESWEQFYPEMGKPKLAYLSPTELPENYCYILPQRTWIELTEDEIVLISADCAATHQHTDIHFARAIEAKLKEKNT